MTVEELHTRLKEKERQMQVLFQITQAINTNEPADKLFRMYNEYMEEGMDIERMMFFVQHEGQWVNVSESGGLGDRILTIDDQIVEYYTEMTEIGEDAEPILQGYDFIVPVWHKDQPIAFAVIKDLDKSKNRRNFIMTITNIIGVAIENKRLFKRQVEQERYRKEVELASEVQKMLIPTHMPRSPKLEVASIYKPQLNVGGDYYDFIELQNGNYIFCIADISGKGVGAALLMANFQATLHNALESYENLNSLIRYLNKLLVKITQSERIITLFIAEYDQETGTLHYINAGHTSPFLLMGGSVRKLHEGCTLLGAFDEIHDIEVGHVTLTETALIMAYTDGLTDLINDDGDYFDESFIKDFLLRNVTFSVDMLNRNLLQEMDAFKGEQDYPDDIAILTCKFLQPQPVLDNQNMV